MTMSTSKTYDSIFIIGGGVAGLSAAIALRQKNLTADITIIEAYPGDDNKRMGLGMILMDNGIRALKKLNADELLVDAQPILRCLLKEVNGTVVIDEKFEEVFCCSRKGILNALEATLEQLDTMGTGRVQRVYKNCSNVLLSKDSLQRDYVRAIMFSDGSSIKVSERDLVLGCDGVHSKLCLALNKDMERPISQVNEIVTSTHAPQLVQKLGNTFHKTVCMECGLAYGLLAATPSQVIGFVQFDRSRYDVPTSAEEKRYFFHLVSSKIDDPCQRELFEEYASIAHMETAHVWKPINAQLPNKLHVRNAVLIGDAAHPLLPFTSQGTSMALEDSVILAHIIGMDHDSLHAALGEFIKLRIPVANQFIEGGRKILEGFINKVSLAPYLSKKDVAFSRISRKIASAVAFHSEAAAEDYGEKTGIEEGKETVEEETNGCPLFGADKVDFSNLSTKAFNYRWATMPENCIPLTAADSDFPIALPIQQAITDYVREGYMNYSPAKGLPALRQAIGDKYSVPPEQVFVTSAAASSMFLIMEHLLTQPGDEVIIADPVDFLFQRAVEAAGGVVRRYKLHPPNHHDRSRAHWSFDIAEVEALINPKTKVIGICNPHNPVGRVWNREELKKLTDLAICHDLEIWSDEVWADISYVNFVPTMHLSEKVAARTYTVMGFSKGYCLAGLRLGCIIAPTSKDVDMISKRSLAEDTAYGVSVLSQVAGIAALQKAGEWQRHFRRHVESQCWRAVQYLNQIPSVYAVMPEGTFVVFANVSYYLQLAGMDEEDLCNFLKASAHVALVPGSPTFFGPSAAGHVRLSVATSVEVLDEALQRIKRGLDFIRALHIPMLNYAQKGEEEQEEKKQEEQ